MEASKTHNLRAAGLSKGSIWTEFQIPVLRPANLQRYTKVAWAVLSVLICSWNKRTKPNQIANQEVTRQIGSLTNAFSTKLLTPGLWGIMKDLCVWCSKDVLGAVSLSLTPPPPTMFLSPMIPLAILHAESFIAFVTSFAAQLYNIWIISLSCVSVDFSLLKTRLSVTSVSAPVDGFLMALNRLASWHFLVRIRRDNACKCRL